MNEAGSVGLFFIGGGALGVLIAVFLYFRARRFVREAVSTEGTVVGLIERSGEDGTTFSPVVQFTTQAGQPASFTERVGRNPPKYQPGDVVKVKYRPEEPEKARIPSFMGLWYLPAFSAFLSLVFVGTGIVVLMTRSDDVASPPDISVPAQATTLPGVVPGASPTGAPAGGATLTVRLGGGAPEVLGVTCESIRDSRGGRQREVLLRLDPGTLKLVARPFTGEGGYVPGQNLTVRGTLFGDGGEVTGAITFDATTQAGAVNLIAGQSSASGSWDCSGVSGGGA